MRLTSLLPVIVFSLFVFVSPALAEEAASVAPVFGDFGHIAAGLGIGLAVFGAAMAQGKIASSALEGISRNPGASGSMFVPFMIGLALVESLVLFAFLVTSGLAGTQ